MHASMRVGPRPAASAATPVDTGHGHGAYGLTLRGLVPDLADLVPAPAGWQPWTVSHQAAPRRPAADWTDRLDGARALVALGPGTARLDRHTRTTVLELPTAPAPAELTHPYLSASGAVAAWWRGEVALHGGAFVAGGQVWGLLGDREAGKSTTVAACWLAGAPIFADDLVVVRGRTALAGPRSLDLREPSARALGIGEPLGLVGLRNRWRVRLAEVPAELPLGGFITLGWGADLDLTPLPMSERPAALLAAHAVLAAPADATALLELFTVPFWRLTRPRDLAGVPRMAELLLTRLGG